MGQLRKFCGFVVSVVSVNTVPVDMQHVVFIIVKRNFICCTELKTMRRSVSNPGEGEILRSRSARDRPTRRPVQWVLGHSPGYRGKAAGTWC